MASTQDQIIAAAQNAPHLVDLAKANDPDLFKLLTGPSATSVWATPVTAMIVGLAARYGLQWDAATCSALAGFVIFVGTGVFHYLLPQPAAKQ